jgi:acetoin utilization protein AcuB
MLMPSIDRYMTRQPWTIERTATLKQTRAFMDAHRIRHLPVVDGGKLAGIVSERDLRYVEKLGCEDPDQITIGELMMIDVFTAMAYEPVDVVLETMAEQKYGAVVILGRNGSIDGIFTTVDALGYFVDVLRRAAG